MVFIWVHLPRRFVNELCYGATTLSPEVADATRQGMNQKKRPQQLTAHQETI